VKKAIILLLSLIFLAVGSWFLVVPEQTIADLIEDSLDGGLSLKTEGFRKGLFFSFRADRVSLLKRGDVGRQGSGEPAHPGDSPADAPVAILKDLRGSLNLLSVAKLSPRVDFDCGFEGGALVGTIALVDGTVTVKVDHVGLANIPLLKGRDVIDEGDLSGDLRFDHTRGEVKFWVRDAKLKDLFFNGNYLPLSFFHTVTGALMIDRGTADVRSLNLQGRGISARVKGTLIKSGSKLTMEVMTDSSFQAGPVLQAALGRYMVSPGYYVVPVTSDLTGL